MLRRDVKYTPNPFTATTELVLADGRHWFFRPDFNAMAIMCSAFNKNLAELVALPLSTELLKLWVYAGVARYARERGEEWTIEKAAQLVTVEQYEKIAPRVSEAIALALFGTEPAVAAEEEISETDAARRQTESKPWDWRSAQHAAVSLGIPLQEFWAMTLWEFQLCSSARYDGIKQDRLAAANLTANLMNCWLKRPVTGKQLLGISESVQGTGRSFAEMGEAEKEAALEQVRQNLERRPKANDGEQESATA